MTIENAIKKLKDLACETGLIRRVLRFVRHEKNFEGDNRSWKE